MSPEVSSLSLVITIRSKVKQRYIDRSRTRGRESRVRERGKVRHAKRYTAGLNYTGHVTSHMTSVAE